MPIRRHRRRHRPRHWLIASLSCLLAACQTAPQNASLQCGAGGAVGGFALCKLLGGKDADCAKWGAAAGIGGAAFCYQYANNLEKRRQELAGHENDLDHRIAYVRGLNQDAQALNADLGKQVTDSRAHTDQLLVQIRQNQPTSQQLARERKDRDDQVKAASAQVDVGRQALAEVKTWRSQRSGAASSDLDAAISRQEQLLAQAQQQVEQLASQRARI